MPGIVLTFPIVAGKVEAWRRFCQELSGFRHRPYEASRKRLGVTCERMVLVETAYGSTAVTTLEAPNVSWALGQIIASVHTFDVWYRQRLQELHGINLAGYEQFVQQTPMPANQKVHFEWMLSSSNPKKSQTSCLNGHAEGKTLRMTLTNKPKNGKGD